MEKIYIDIVGPLTSNYNNSKYIRQFSQYDKHTSSPQFTKGELMGKKPVETLSMGLQKKAFCKVISSMAYFHKIVFLNSGILNYGDLGMPPVRKRHALSLSVFFLDSLIYPNSWINLWYGEKLEVAISLMAHLMPDEVDISIIRTLCLRPQPKKLLLKAE